MDKENIKKTQMGRPKLSREKARTSMFTVRLKEHEKAEIQQVSASQDMRTSDWARNALLQALKDAKSNT
jgi:hypothetical protein